MPIPDFLIIGVAKSGTTSLYAYLRQHPEIFLPILKEPHFFAFSGFDDLPKDPYSQNGKFITNRLDYEHIFAPAQSAQVLGEASTSTFFSAYAANYLRCNLPKIKLILLLRHPADRAFSHYCHNRRNGLESCRTFQQALMIEPQRQIQSWWYWFLYRSAGYYTIFLEEYFNLFSHDNIKIYLFDDLVSDPQAVVSDICTFLSVSPLNLSAPKIYNEGSMPRSLTLHRLLRRLGLSRVLRNRLSSLNHLFLIDRLHNSYRYKPPFDPALRDELTTGYRSDILRLQDMIKRDLSSWLHND